MSTAVRWKCEVAKCGVLCLISEKAGSWERRLIYTNVERIGERSGSIARVAYNSQKDPGLWRNRVEPQRRNRLSGQSKT